MDLETTILKQQLEETFGGFSDSTLLFVHNLLLKEMSKRTIPADKFEATEDKPVVFWSGSNAKGKGGYFIRNNLKEFIERLIEHGENPIGIAYNGSYNLEIIVEDKDTKTI